MEIQNGKIQTSYNVVENEKMNEWMFVKNKKIGFIEMCLKTKSNE